MHRSAERNSPETSTGLTAGESPIIAGDTIAAISTPPGEGAITLVRVSGADAVAIADKIFRGKEKPSRFASHVQHFGEIFDAAGQLIDQVMLSIHRAPASYTGEDLIEISCHGGMLVSARVMEACLCAGSRGARPGEFTERAFLNGKMDLTQAEAVIDLIRAKTDLALRSATEQLEGRLGEKIGKVRDELISQIAHIDASIDFPEEGIAPDEAEKLGARLDSVREEMTALLATANQGRILREGVRVVIFGATNAGMGTSTSDLEREGIARTEKSLQMADLRLHIADRNAPKPPHFDDRAGNSNEIVLLNKGDLPEHSDWKNFDALRISCATREGLPDLEQEILARITKQNLRPESAVAINTRHRDCLRRALESCNRASVALGKGLSPEYVAVDLNEALHAVGEIIGAVRVEQILDSVFGQFCIGK